MNSARITAGLVMPLRIASIAAALTSADVSWAQGEPIEREQNMWPGPVRQLDVSGTTTISWMAAGPLAFGHPGVDGGWVTGVRPLYYRTTDPSGDYRSAFFLYPLFSYIADETTYRWSVFELIRRWGRRAGAPAPQSIFDQRREFEVFPFWFSRETGDGELSYRALFPIYGTIKNKLGFERLSWTLFPLYVENEKRGAVTTSTPWPIIRVTRGAAHGFGIWPLFNRVERPGVYKQAYYLWPLGYHSVRYPRPDDPPGTEPQREVGALPFYARSTGPGYVNVSYGWPFFGYTDRTLPVRYHENRYFWPLLVQGRGDDRYVNRWGPFYTHSISKGYDKTWYLWPVWRRAHWQEEGLLRTKTQLLYFLYWSQRQESIARPQLAAAKLTHVWPLWSQWDNAAGRRQWQFFSPLDVFFPSNEKIRENWSPLFAIARHDQRAPGETRTSLLWDAITWRRSAAEDRREIHVGPLLSIAQHGENRRVTVGRGLLGFSRSAGRGWKAFWWQFSSGRPAGQQP